MLKNAVKGPDLFNFIDLETQNLKFRSIAETVLERKKPF